MAGAGNPVEPFDASLLPSPEESDPLHRQAYRAALAGADAYRLTRAAIRRDGPIIRLGNRLTQLPKYGEIAFLALGRAAISQALAVTEALGSHLTQGFAASPDRLPEEVPFRSLTLPTTGPGHPRAEETAGVARELAQGLGPNDLLLLLLSPGAFGFLALPPPSEGRGAWTEGLDRLAAAGLSPTEVGRFARLTAGGPVAGRLSEGVQAEVVTLVVERGEGAALLGGGPTIPISPEERTLVQASLERVGAWTALPPALRSAVTGSSASLSMRPPKVRRPVVIAEPADALRDASEAVADKKWWPRLAEMSNPLPPAASADRFLARVEEITSTEDDPDSKGLVVFAPVSLGLLEGVDERPAIAEFLARASINLRRRDVTVALARTAGGSSKEALPPGGVVGARSSDSGGTARARSIPMRSGITDVGMLATAVVPRRVVR